LFLKKTETKTIAKKKAKKKDKTKDKIQFGKTDARRSKCRHSKNNAPFAIFQHFFIAVSQ